METILDCGPVLTQEAWDACIVGLDSGRVVEVNEEVFDYFLEVLPPKSMGKLVEVPGWATVRTSYGFAEGWEPIKYFWTIKDKDRRAGERYYAWKSQEVNRD